MKKELRELLVKGLKDFNVDVNEEQITAFNTYLKELLKWNSKYNLTAITDENEIIIKHFIDSAIIAEKLPCKSGNIIDIGSGAGFPGIVLKILNQEIKLTSVDSVGKKIFFQKNLVRQLGIDGVNLISTRVEGTGFIKEFKNHFDCAVARAFKKISEILILSYPLVKKGGLVLVFKGRNYKQDITELEESEISGRFILNNVDSYVLPFINRHHHILTYQKK